MCFDQKEMPSPSVSPNNIYTFNPLEQGVLAYQGRICILFRHRAIVVIFELVNPTDCENQVLAWRMLAKKILLRLGTLAHTKS